MDNPLFKRLLVPTDGSESSVKAGRLAFRVAKVHGAQVTVLHVIDVVEADELAHASEKTEEEVRAEMEGAARGYLRHLENVAQEYTVQVETVTREGEPYKEIVALAQAIGADLIVMGHVGRRGPRRKIMGSVAERVIRFAECPVLVD